MRTDAITADDIIEAHIRGRIVLGRVTEIRDGVVYFAPSVPAAGGGTPSRGRSPPTGARPGAAAPSSRNPTTRRQRSTGSCRSRTATGSVRQPNAADSRQHPRSNTSAPDADCPDCTSPQGFSTFGPAAPTHAHDAVAPGPASGTYSPFQNPCADSEGMICRSPRVAGPAGSSSASTSPQRTRTRLPTRKALSVP